MRFAAALPSQPDSGLDRRTFLRRSGLVAGGLATLGALPLTNLRKADAGPPPPAGAKVTTHKNLCTHCSVGCSVIAEVANGVWIGQEPVWDSPINRGSHCCKGAAVRDDVLNERRLRYPMKLVGGQWNRISWDQAIDEIGDKLMEIREKAGPESVYWLGSAKFTNEAAYLNRKFAAFWGTNNSDHQARICHSTTVAGVANTWGYGAMTNSYNDIRNAKTIVVMGGNPAEAHPVSLQHILEGKELNRANMIVIDPRMTRTAAHATEYVRVRPGTHIPTIYGMLWHIFQNGWEDKEFIRQRVYGLEDIRSEIEKWTPAGGRARHRAARGAGQARRRADREGAARDADLGDGADPVHRRNRERAGELHPAACHRQCRLSRHRRQHFPRPHQRAGRDRSRPRCDDPAALLRPHRGRLEALVPGVGGRLRVDAVALRQQDADGDLGHPEHALVRRHLAAEGPGRPARHLESHVHHGTWRQHDHADAAGRRAGSRSSSCSSCAIPIRPPGRCSRNRKDGTYLLPACTSFEMDGSRTASNRSLQWGEQIVPPVFESKNDYDVMYMLAQKLGFADRMFKNIKVENGAVSAEDILREINRGGWSTGYCGQSPERLKAHMRNQAKFDLVTLRAPKDDPEVGGDFYGLPWPCWGTPEFKHPGSAILYNTNLPVKEGGGTFRARFGVERVVKRKVMENGQEVEKEVHENLLAEGSYSVGSAIMDGYPEFTLGVLKKLGWDGDLTPQEMAIIQKVNAANPDAVSWSTDLSGGIQRVAIEHGCAPYGNGKARMIAWNLPDPIPVHREVIYTSRPDLVANYPTLPDAKQFRVPNLGFTVQKMAVDQGIVKQFPLILSSGRLVEYEGGGEETRSNKWLAELKQDMYVEINPADAAERGITNNAWVWVTGAEYSSKTRVKALVTERVGKGVAWMPFHFAGWFEGVDQRSKYPKGADPIVLGESVNTLTTYGFDPVTGMQEPKATLCQIRAA